MITTQRILDTVVSKLKKTFPEAIFDAKLQVDNRQFDPATNTTTLLSNPKVNVEVIFDNLTQNEIQASELLLSDLKLYVIGDKTINIDYYEFIVICSDRYRIFKKLEHQVGDKTALWTIVARK